MLNGNEWSICSIWSTKLSWMFGRAGVADFRTLFRHYSEWIFGCTRACLCLLCQCFRLFSFVSNLSLSLESIFSLSHPFIALFIALFFCIFLLAPVFFFGHIFSSPDKAHFWYAHNVQVGIMLANNWTTFLLTQCRFLSLFSFTFVIISASSISLITVGTLLLLLVVVAVVPFVLSINAAPFHVLQCADAVTHIFQPINNIQTGQMRFCFANLNAHVER